MMVILATAILKLLTMLNRNAWFNRNKQQRLCEKKIEEDLSNNSVGMVYVTRLRKRNTIIID